MDDVKLRVLSQLEPEGLDAEGQGWQQRKSVQTRIAILEASIDSLQKHGYGQTTMQLIAGVAGISRGAMLHHYATKLDLIGAVIDYTLYKRMEVFLDGIRELEEGERVDEMAGITIFWKSLLTREFAAYLELSIAARTDPELAEIFLPKARRFNRAELTEVIHAFPEWAGAPERYALAMDYVSAVFEGLVVNRDIWAEEDQKVLAEFVGRTVAMLRTGELALAEG